ncbi:MAG: hypothetical protein HGA45_09100 [Chloroflexales bacterium]|nr:hypothetical protein [Chloroflexales bacterium]
MQAAATTYITADEYDAAVAEAQRRAEEWITGIIKTYNVDVLMPGMLYVTAGSAGAPGVTIPIGRIGDTTRPAQAGRSLQRRRGVRAYSPGGAP